MFIKSIERTCDDIPSQWEAELHDGRMVYVRYRWGCLTIQISKTKTHDIFDALNGNTLKQVQLGGDYDGEMEDKHMMPHLIECLTNE